jgi:tryptophanyl-tRNA synthetase
MSLPARTLDPVDPTRSGSAFDESLLDVRSTDVVLTGDRPTGPLHLGHYAGSLRTRLAIQGRCPQTILIADLQALTDNSGQGARVAANVLDVALDYIAAGIDPTVNTIAVQSQLPALAELTMLYLNLVTVARLERNPTVKAEIELRGFARDVPAGFLCYPASQAADITGVRATLVPVGDDQLPMLEQTNEIVRRVNRLADSEILPECRPLLTKTPRLPGIDGRKASKSLGNAIPLTASPSELRALVRAMYTDPNHQRVSDPGRIEGNVVFAYLDAFDPDGETVEALKARYQRGGMGDVALKQRLENVLEMLIAPMRDRRAAAAAHRDVVREMLVEGTAIARRRTQAVLEDVRRGFALIEL